MRQKLTWIYSLVTCFVSWGCFKSPAQENVCITDSCFCEITIRRKVLKCIFPYDWLTKRIASINFKSHKFCIQYLFFVLCLWREKLAFFGICWVLIRHFWHGEPFRCIRYSFWQNICCIKNWYYSKYFVVVDSCHMATFHIWKRWRHHKV